MKLVLAPAKAGWKVSDKLTVRLLTDPDDEEPTALTVHWLFCSVLPLPAVTGPSHAVPPSFLSQSAFEARSKNTQQPLTPLRLLFTSICAVTISANPLGSENR